MGAKSDACTHLFSFSPPLHVHVPPGDDCSNDCDNGDDYYDDDDDDAHDQTNLNSKTTICTK